MEKENNYLSEEWIKKNCPEKEWNLSDKIIDKYCGGIVKVNSIKEFIRRDTELINQFACGQLTLLELKQEREKLAGEKLSSNSEKESGK